MKVGIFGILCLATIVEGHFRIPFPGERNATNWGTQLEGPCGGDDVVVFPRYPWNPKGSPIDLNMYHNRSVGAIYFCPHETCNSTADFDILLKSPFDMVGAGNFCITSLNLPEEYQEEGLNGTIQVIYAGTSENYSEYDYMYNCVDIVVSSEGPLFNGSQCSNTTGVQEYYDGAIDSSFSLEENSLLSKTEVPSLEGIQPNTLLNEYYNATKGSTTTSAGNQTIGTSSMSCMTDMAGMSGMSGMSGMGCMAGMSSMSDMSEMTGMSSITDMSISSATTSSSKSSQKMASTDRGTSSSANLAVASISFQPVEAFFSFLMFFLLY